MDSKNPTPSKEKGIAYYTGFAFLSGVLVYWGLDFLVPRLSGPGRFFETGINPVRLVVIITVIDFLATILVSFIFVRNERFSSRARKSAIATLFFFLGLFTVVATILSNVRDL